MANPNNTPDPLARQEEDTINRTLLHGCGAVVREIWSAGSTVEFFGQKQNEVMKSVLGPAIFGSAVNYKTYLKEQNQGEAPHPASAYDHALPPKGENTDSYAAVEAMYGFVIGSIVAKNCLRSDQFRRFSDNMARCLSVQNRQKPFDLAQYLQANAAPVQGSLEKACPYVLRVYTHSGRYPKNDSVYARAISYMVGGAINELVSDAIQRMHPLDLVQRSWALNEQHEAALGNCSTPYDLFPDVFPTDPSD